MFERAGRGNRAVLLHPIFADTGPDQLDEFQELCRSAGVEVTATLTAPRDRPDARFFVGSGKIEEVAERVAATGADLVLVSRPLSAIQERNIEKRCECRVLDRTTLILDIFALRARSHEGKLQVELAQLRHISTRLVRGWTHLERQKGGIGLRGPGETQLETDRRLIGQRIAYLKGRLDKVRAQRAQSRRRRERAHVFTVALVGYTNAGKSTLFNALTDSDVGTQDMQFATLDPTVRQLPNIPTGNVLLVDTVGFVSDLPHELVAAFHATLQETREADLLLHVIDASDPFHQQREHDVDDVLESVGASDIPTVRLFNKTDLVERPATTRLNADGQVKRMDVSALLGTGLEELKETIAIRLKGQRINTWISLEGQHAKLRSQLFDLGAVEEEKVTDEGHWLVHINLSQQDAEQLGRMPGAEGILVRENILSPSALVARQGEP
ncbi:MAG: GTPase HflX [Gammaproteobacteria bacterium]|nr:GTPase HflX [Gammaproteobacteria bacterium]NNK98084.1 GTPase HflX [Xanthomonadales bacterium]